MAKTRRCEARPDGRVVLTFEVTEELWDLLLEVAEGEPWDDVAANALAAGLEQVRIPTLCDAPTGWRGPRG